LNFANGVAYKKSTNGRALFARHGENRSATLSSAGALWRTDLLGSRYKNLFNLIQFFG
jgi:hypothetical protein